MTGATLATLEALSEGLGVKDEAEPGFGQLGLAPPIAQAVGGARLRDRHPGAAPSASRTCWPAAISWARPRPAPARPRPSPCRCSRASTPTASSPQVLVLTPTRELALQVAEAFQRYAQHLKGFHVLPIYGGQSYGLAGAPAPARPPGDRRHPGADHGPHAPRHPVARTRSRPWSWTRPTRCSTWASPRTSTGSSSTPRPSVRSRCSPPPCPRRSCKVARDHLNDPVEVRDRLRHRHRRHHRPAALRGHPLPQAGRADPHPGARDLRRAC